MYFNEKENWLLFLQLTDPEISRIFKILTPKNKQECREIRKSFEKR